ncbi:unnamed protein product [Owenia fusiformis]|uniref:HIG1 domain-containing protein n=1 Tax=Owenia fusiformis TaxID=6347 RepID=A0A8S4MW37_OWEFU|nr:unnamed protein product [Owenia fusiformis]
MSNSPVAGKEMTSYEEESQASKLSRKIQEAPYVPLGWAGLIGACVYAATQYKHRGRESTSVFLMKLRVGAQSMVVGAIALGMGYTLLKDYVKKENKQKASDSNSEQ